MSYRIQRTAKADEQLRDIVLYRAELTGRAGAALDLLDQLELGIGRLRQFPESGTQPRYASLRARGYRVLLIEKYLVFYKVEHERKLVTVHAVLDGRRDYRNLI